MSDCIHDNVAWGECQDCGHKLTKEEMEADYKRVEQRVAAMWADGTLSEVTCSHCGHVHECLKVKP